MKNLPDDYREIYSKARKVLKDAQRRAGNRDKKHPTYKNILCLITPELEEEFFFWYYIEYKRMKIKHPNETLMLDRINNMGHYEMKNIQLITLEENETKKALDHAIQYCGREPYKDEKYCHSCHSIKKRKTDFYIDKCEKDGLRGNCISCSRITNKKSKQKARERKRNERS